MCDPKTEAAVSRKKYDFKEDVPAWRIKLRTERTVFVQFTVIFDLKFFKPFVRLSVCFLLFCFHVYHNLKRKGNRNKTGLKKFKTKNKFTPQHIHELKCVHLFVTQDTTFFIYLLPSIVNMSHDKMYRQYRVECVHVTSSNSQIQN